MAKMGTSVLLDAVRKSWSEKPAEFNQLFRPNQSDCISIDAVGDNGLNGSTDDLVNLRTVFESTVSKYPLIAGKKAASSYRLDQEILFTSVAAPGGDPMLVCKPWNEYTATSSRNKYNIGIRIV